MESGFSPGGKLDFRRRRLCSQLPRRSRMGWERHCQTGWGGARALGEDWSSLVIVGPERVSHLSKITQKFGARPRL